MKLIIAVKEGDLIARITGDIDHHSAASLREEIDLQFTEKKPSRLLIDLGETEFMDSSGLGLILGRKRKCDEAGAKLVLLNPTEGCLKILRLAGMDKQIETKYI
jgi:stage II sporulation protein AA (anti-sigma F factor antagonist)